MNLQRTSFEFTQKIREDATIVLCIYFVPAARYWNVRVDGWVEGKAYCLVFFREITPPKLFLCHLMCLKVDSPNLWRLVKRRIFKTKALFPSNS